MAAVKPAVAAEAAIKAEPKKVVGLPSAPVTKKPRRGAKKSALPVDNALDSVVNADIATTSNLAAVPEVAAPSEPLALDTQPVAAVEDDLTPEEDKRVSPVAVLQKRIKVHTKKLQRITAYETQPEKLNVDQQKAVASKPALEQNIKELQELVTVFQAEEVEEQKRLQRREAASARKVKVQVQEAVAAYEAESQVHLAFLLQFLHLRSLFVPGESSLVPPVVPAVVQNATGQEFAAVMSLFDQLANGPLSGGGEDALQRIRHLHEGAPVEIVTGVDYARIKQMIGDLTAPPAELAEAAPAENGLELHNNVAQEGVNGYASGPLGGISFMQASDIVAAPPELDQAAVALATPAHDPFAHATTAATDFDAPATNWADDIDQPTTQTNALGFDAAAAEPATAQGTLPPPVPSAADVSTPAKAVEEGFQTVSGGGAARGSRRGAPNGRGRGQGERGRGGPHAARGGRASRERTEGDRPPRPEGERRGGRGGPRGAPRGEHRGRGRGGQGAPAARQTSQSQAAVV